MRSLSQEVYTHAMYEATVTRPYYDHCLSELDNFTEDVQFIQKAHSSYMALGGGRLVSECDSLAQEVDRLKAKLRLGEKVLDQVSPPRSWNCADLWDSESAVFP